MKKIYPTFLMIFTFFSLIAQNSEIYTFEDSIIGPTSISGTEYYFSVTDNAITKNIFT